MVQNNSRTPKERGRLLSVLLILGVLSYPFNLLFLFLTTGFLGGEERQLIYGLLSYTLMVILYIYIWYWKKAAVYILFLYMIVSLPVSLYFISTSFLTLGAVTYGMIIGWFVFFILLWVYAIKRKWQFFE